MPIIVAGTLDFAGDTQTCTDIITSGAAHIFASRAEGGCIAYNWAVDPLHPGRIHVYEEWSDEKALLRHFSDPSYHAMRVHLEAQTLTGFSVMLYAAGKVEPVYDDLGQPRGAIFDVSLD
jgi:quinol monooxygenase YgiN